ncbi:MAG: choice-of-anchor B family protein [Saprospiraceae bacterium]|nr:choice-of-anchor B family protein [Saprospiraceae bacterium]
MNRIVSLFTFAFFVLFSVTDTQAQISPAVNITLRSNLPFAGQDCANICGYAANGKEYALVGNETGVGIVDVTNPSAPILLKQVPALTSIWREIKVYSHYAYVTTEAAGQGLQIIDLTKLSLSTPDVDVKSFKGPDGDLVSISKIHSLHIDVDKGFLYAFGGSSTIKVNGVNTSVNGAVVLDIKTDPWNPKYVGKYSTNYIHDGFVINDTLYGAHVYAGYFSIIDFRNKTAPVVLSTKTTPTAFTHNTWRSDDGKSLFTTDENNGSYLTSYNVSNTSNPVLLDKIRTPSGANAIVHNTHVLNDFLITSWYTEGVTIVDAHRPQNLVQVGQYDTYNGAGATFNGAWGVYPYLPSGNLIVSNIENGLYVLTPQYVRACYLEGVVTNRVTGGPLSGVLVKINSTDMDKQATSNITGNYYTGQVSSGTFSVTYSKTGYVSKTVSVALVNGSVAIQDVALDPVSIPVELTDLSAKYTNKAVQLNWTTALETNINSFDIERSTDWAPSVFEKIGELKAAGRASIYTFEDDQPQGQRLYYRLKINDASIDATKTVYSKTVSVLLPNNLSVKVTPSVSSGNFMVENGEKVEVYNLFGQSVFAKQLVSGSENIDLSHLPQGSYWIQVYNKNIQQCNKIVIAK